MLKCLDFSHTTGSLCYDATVGVLQKCFCSDHCGQCANTYSANHFCAHGLFDSAYVIHIDHVSEINYY